MYDQRLKSIYIYPIKSGGRIPLVEVEVVERGIKWDRRWMIVDANGKFLTQRENRKLALLSIQLEEPSMIIRLGELQKELRVPLHLEASSKTMTVRVWSDDCQSFLFDGAVDAILSEFLGQKCSLVYMPDSSNREADGEGDTGLVSFADGFPFLLTWNSSLAELNTRMASPLSMTRFRPNLVIEGGDPFCEDKMRGVRIGSIEFELAKACARCVIVNNCQDSGVSSPEPLKILGSFRNLTLNGATGILFGQNGVHKSLGKLKVGMPVEPLY